MKKALGIARCGLACCVCGENTQCIGCKSDGCKDRKECKNRQCTMEKGIIGCWQCTQFPCAGGMLDKPRIRAFAAFVKQYGEEKLLECLARNERDGVQYHRAGQLTGDYDMFATEKEIFEALLHGFTYAVSSSKKA